MQRVAREVGCGVSAVQRVEAELGRWDCGIPTCRTNRKAASAAIGGEGAASRQSSRHRTADGWVSIQDRHSFVVGVIDCTAGGAQECFERLLPRLLAGGLSTGFVHCDDLRWFLAIYPDNRRFAV